MPPYLLPPAHDLTPLFTPALLASLIVVLVVFAGLLVRGALRTRRVIRTVTCPENDRPALVVVNRDPKGDVVVDCSQWHDRPLDCGERCLARPTGTDA